MTHFSQDSLWAAIDRLRNAANKVEQVLSAPGECPTIRRQDLDQIADDLGVALWLLAKLTKLSP